MPKPTISALVSIAAVIVLAFVLNPSPDKHREKIKEVVAERSQLERLLGIGQLTSFASRYHSFGVASYTTVNDKTTSVGAFGMVFVTE
jgi:hypothetical protein